MLVDIGFDDFSFQIQQWINIEMVNHDDATVALLQIHQSYGYCSLVPDAIIRAKHDRGLYFWGLQQMPN
jgi:hypothetical protein